MKKAVQFIEEGSLVREPLPMLTAMKKVNLQNENRALMVLFSFCSGQR